MEALLGADPPIPQETWQRLKGWCKAAVNHAPPSARAKLEQNTAERVDLYSFMPYLGANILVTFRPAPVDDIVPTEDNI